MQDVIEFGTILKFVRKSRRITQEALADSCGLDRTYIGLLERGKRSPTMETLCKLSVGLDILPSALLGYWEDTLAMKWRTQIHSLIRGVIAQHQEGAGDLNVPAVHMGPELIHSHEEIPEDPQAELEKFDSHKNLHFLNKQARSDQYNKADRHSHPEHSLTEEIISSTDKIILLHLIKSKSRKTLRDKSAFFEGIQSALSLVLANEALGFDAAKNRTITQSIVDIIEKIYSHNEEILIRMNSE